MTTAVKITIEKALNNHNLIFGTRFLVNKKEYIFINKTSDFEKEEWINKEGQNRSTTWNMTIVVSKDDKGNYKVFKSNQLISIIEEE